MSGGSYDYVSGKIRQAAEELRERHGDQTHLLAFADQLDKIASVLHDIEWADSGDTAWTPAIDAKVRALLLPGAELHSAITVSESAFASLLGSLRVALAEIQNQKGGTP